MRLYTDKVFYRSVSKHLRLLGFTSSAPWQKNVVASYRLRGTVICVRGGNTIQVIRHGTVTTHERCDVISALRIIDEARAERS
jgi:hypothetical protein